MKYIDPHIHMSSRTTDDYEAMSSAGIVAVIEPAFWLGQLRTHPGSYQDYLATLVGWECFRASRFNIRHCCAIGLNAKEANNESLARAVLEMLPLFLDKENVVAVGEIGFDEITPAEEKYFHAQLELAKEYDLPVIVHTPHMDKLNGASRSMAIIGEHGLSPRMVVIDHNTEITVKNVLDRGYWTGFTIYPRSKMGKDRMVEIVRRYGVERIIVNSSADWGISDPLAVPKTAALMLERGIPADRVKQVSYANALAVFRQSGKFNEADWSEEASFQELDVFSQGNTISRG